MLLFLWLWITQEDNFTILIPPTKLWLLHQGHQFQSENTCIVLPRFPGWATRFLEMAYGELCATFSFIWWMCYRCYKISMDVYINHILVDLYVYVQFLFLFYTCSGNLNAYFLCYWRPLDLNWIKPSCVQWPSWLLGADITVFKRQWQAHSLN